MFCGVPAPATQVFNSSLQTRDRFGALQGNTCNQCRITIFHHQGFSSVRSPLLSQDALIIRKVAKPGRQGDRAQVTIFPNASRGSLSLLVPHPRTDPVQKTFHLLDCLDVKIPKRTKRVEGYPYHAWFRIIKEIRYLRKVVRSSFGPCFSQRVNRVHLIHGSG